MPINYYIFLSVALFCIGVAGVLTRRNAIIIFMCIELMLNAVNLLLIAFSKMHHATAAYVGSECRNQRTDFCFFHHGGRRCGSECGTGHHRHDVPEYAFCGHQLFKQIETLKRKPKAKKAKQVKEVWEYRKYKSIRV